ncbi:MAG TPA: acylneuraminate cytidylyltransferase family protein [Bacillota bacterium]
MLKVLAIIPARGGSRSIPRKNLALLDGKPLIAHTIAVARSVPEIDRIVVSTDSPDIAAAARRCGAETPFLRPAELARDDTPGIDPLIHAVQWLAQHEGYRPDYVLCLQPTSPLRNVGDIRQALRVAAERDAEAVVSVVPVKHHPYWTRRIEPDGRLVDFLPDNPEVARRQDLPPAYALNGAVYLMRYDILMQRRTWQTDRTYALVMPPERSIDIDTPLDLDLAALLLARGRREEGVV